MIVTSFAIFVLGFIVTVITGVGAVLIGLEEAADPNHSKAENLSNLEKKIVGRGEEN